MNLGLKSISTVIAITLAAVATADDKHENHEIIEKVMKEGLKGKESPMAKLLEGNLDEKSTKELATLVQTIKGTKSPVGDQADYEEKVAEFIAALDAVAAGKNGPDDIARLKKAQDCKACHKSHKPKDE